VSRKIDHGKIDHKIWMNPPRLFGGQPGKKEDTDDSNHAYLVKKPDYWLQEERALKGK
jgi:hypothetical protein